MLSIITSKDFSDQVSPSVFFPSFWSNLKYCVISQINVLPSTASELSENGQNAEEHWREMENTSKLRNNILILHVFRVTFLPACDTKKLSSHLYTIEESWVRIFFYSYANWNKLFHKRNYGGQSRQYIDRYLCSLSISIKLISKK